MKIIVLQFGRWGRKSNKFLIYDRLYIKGYKWTPFCWVGKRFS